MNRRHTLPDVRIEALREAYERGLTRKQTFEETGISRPTVIKYFRRFEAQRVPRGEVRDRRRLGYRSSRYKPRRSYNVPPPAYDGPDWIGKAIDG